MSLFPHAIFMPTCSKDGQLLTFAKEHRIWFCSTCKAEWNTHLPADGAEADRRRHTA